MEDGDGRWNKIRTTSMSLEKGKGGSYFGICELWTQEPFLISTFWFLGFNLQFTDLFSFSFSLLPFLSYVRARGIKKKKKERERRRWKVVQKEETPKRQPSCTRLRLKPSWATLSKGQSSLRRSGFQSRVRTYLSFLELAQTNSKTNMKASSDKERSH